jgi:ornithine decarboxylase
VRLAEVHSHNGNGYRHRPLKEYTLAGPSCDSCDVIAHEVTLPEVHIGDRLVFYDAGAYTNEYASNFNGFDIPQVMFVSETMFERQVAFS